MSEKGQNLDEIPLEIRENLVKKVCFCGERPLDLNSIDFGRPGSSAGEFFGPPREGGQPKAGGEKSGGTPRQGL